MSEPEKSFNSDQKFYLNKWFLDFIGNDGETMIIYTAELILHSIRIPYFSWLHCNSSGKIRQTSGIRQAEFPEINNNTISWKDKRSGIRGTWEGLTRKVQATIYETDIGRLDWYCYQPASNTILTINETTFSGKGYVEQLIATIPVWKIPMDQLRWGHVVTDDTFIVWIEIRSNKTRSWLWLNGELIEHHIIGDNKLIVPGKGLEIYLDRGTVLEAEKKLTSLADKLTKYIPGVKRLIPVHFLLADEQKWLSKANLYRNNKFVDTGLAVHEYVNFKTVLV